MQNNPPPTSLMNKFVIRTKSTKLSVCRSNSENMNAVNQHQVGSQVKILLLRLELWDFLLQLSSKNTLHANVLLDVTCSCPVVTFDLLSKSFWFLCRTFLHYFQPFVKIHHSNLSYTVCTVCFREWGGEGDWFNHMKSKFKRNSHSPSISPE